jgi:hypothetical protein
MQANRPFSVNNRINQESLAGRSQSFDTKNPAAGGPRYDTGYECELPADVRTELVAPKRPHILGLPPKPKRDGILKWVGAFALSVAILGGTIGNYNQTRSRGTTTPTVAPSRVAHEPTSTPTPGPGGGQASSANNPPAPRAMLIKPAPKATLVKLPPPRAQLVGDLPPLIPGRQYLATMPYNVEVLATYKGQMDSVDLLPSHRNAIGDMRIVNGVPWVWIFAPGATHADWIDP